MAQINFPFNLIEGTKAYAVRVMANLEVLRTRINAGMEADNIADGAVTDAKIGNRTIDQALAPTGNSGLLTILLSWIANRIRAITGKANWSDAPDITLAATRGHVDAATGVHGVGASAVESVSGSQAKVDGHNNNATNVHGVGASSVESVAGAQAKANAVQGNLNTHNGFTTGVHGVGASAVESVAGAQAKVDAHATAATLAHPDNSVTDAKIGNRTANQTLEPTGATGTLTQLLSWIVNRIRAITGTTNWWDAPPTTLAVTDVHMGSTSNIHGVDGSGVESVSGAQEKVAAHSNLTDNPHGVTATQVGAITSIDGVSNPGGDVDLIGGIGITITPNDVDKSITVTATGQAAPAPHASTHAIGQSDVVTPASIGAETPTAAQMRVDAHNSASTGVHGVGVSAVENVAGAQNKVNTHAALTTGTHGVGASAIESVAGAQAKVDSHATLATGVHGVGASSVESVAGAQAKANAALTAANNNIARLFRRTLMGVRYYV